MNSRGDPGDCDFRPDDPDQIRARLEQRALDRITDRHFRAQPLFGPGHPAQQAMHRVAVLAGGATGPEGAAVDRNDLMAALILSPRARAELDALEASLLFLAREAGMTWAQIAFSLGLRSPQAAQQRCGRSGRRSQGAVSRPQSTDPLEPQVPASERAQRAD